MTLTVSANQRLLLGAFPIWFLLCIGAFALLWKLGAGSLAPWDEAIYAEVSKEILQTRNWLTLHWEYQLWFEKPPLFMWVTAILYRVSSVNEFWARLPSAISGIALLGMTYSIGKLAFDRNVGLLGAAILLTCYHFLSFSRFGTMEVMLTLFTYAAIYGYLRVRNDSPKWWYLVWVACGLALMVKGAGGLIAPAAVLLALTLDKRISVTIRTHHFWMGSLMLVLIVAPWHLLMLIKYGRPFISEYIGYHVVARSTRALEGHASSHFYYVGKLIDGFFPWCVLVPFAVVSAVRRSRKDQSRSWTLLLLCALVFGLYTMIPTRRPWYIVPIYPALAVLIAAFIIKLYYAYQLRPLVGRLVVVICAFLLIIGGFYSFVSLYLNLKLNEPLAKLAHMAQSTDPNDRDSLVLLSGVEPIYTQVALFYSNRPIQQAYLGSKPGTEDAARYLNFEDLAEVTRAAPKRIILRKEDVTRLSMDYELEILAENHPLIYARIARGKTARAFER